jgi:hypothetical protein
MADSSLDLSINIGANTQDFASQLQKAENLLAQFQSALKKSTNVGEINYLNTQINNLNTTIDTLNGKMSNMKKPSADATNALGNLSRVAQDAPYGFMGIANNLNPLLESFQRLSKESGGAGGALKSLVSGLTGPAGIGLALGVVSSLVVKFGDDIANWLSGTTELEKAQKKISEGFLENAKAAGTQIVSDQALLSVINDVTIKTDARTAALNALKEKYKGNVELQKTDITDGAELTKIIDKIGDALVRKAKIEATSKIIGEEYAKMLQLTTASMKEQMLNLTSEDYGKVGLKGGETLGKNTVIGFNNAIAQGLSKIDKTGALANLIPQGQTQNFDAQAALQQKAIERTTEKAKVYEDRIKSLQDNLNKLYKTSFEKGDFATGAGLGANTGGGATTTTKKDVDTSTLETLKKEQKLYEDNVYAYKEQADKIAKEQRNVNLEKAKLAKASANEIANIEKQYEIDKLLNEKELGDKLTKMFDAQDKQWTKQQQEAAKEKLATQLQASKDGLDIVKRNFDEESKLAGDDYEKKKEAIKKAMAEIKILMAFSTNPKAIQDLDKAYKDMEKNYKILDIDQKQKDAKKLTQQYEKYAEVIATTLTNGFMTMFDAMQKGENPLQALGNYVGDLVKKLAEAAVQAAIFQGIMMLLSPATAGGFGEGFIGGFKKILGFAEGGVVSQPTIAMVGEGGQSEAIMPLNKLSNMMNSTFNAGAMSGVGGGGGNGQFVLKGNDLVLALQRSNYSLNLRRGNGI